MKKILFLILFFPFAVQAQIAVLIHGYLSDAQTWEWSGVNALLRQDGWQQAGILTALPNASVQPVILPHSQDAVDLFYAVNLPSIAPAIIQSNGLQSALNFIRQQHPDQSLILIGHSAGGVIARLTLVRFGAERISKLITIASPHLGTDKAVRVLDAVDDSGWFGPIKEWFTRQAIGNGLYNILEASRGILFDLAPPVPGNLLFWLNGQAHPDIEYISVVRSSPFVIALDLIVPPFSQDMNRVPALQGRSKVYLSPQAHELSPLDGLLLVQLLRN